MLGGHTPDERLAIMRDPRIGAFGATGLVLTLGLKYLGLVTLPDVERAGMLLCMPVLGRWAMVVGASAAPYARKEGGLAAPFVSELTIRDVVWAAVLAAAAAVFFVGPWVAIPSLALAALTGLGFARLSKRLCGGITGDTLGATNELAEILFLLMAPVSLALMRAIECRHLAQQPFDRPILDVGCGDGTFGRILFNGVTIDAGIDQDPDEVQRARATRCYEDLRVSRIEALPFESGSFATAFSNCVLEHVADIGGALAEIRRVLRPGAAGRRGSQRSSRSDQGLPDGAPGAG